MYDGILYWNIVYYNILFFLYNEKYYLSSKLLNIKLIII